MPPLIEQHDLQLHVVVPLLMRLVLQELALA
jgi:hypothetical protein